MIAIAALLCLGSCRSSRPDHQALVGDYVLVAIGDEAANGAERLTLRNDGTYSIRGTRTINGTWRMTETTNGSQVLLDSDGYPIDQSGGTIRLLKDEDTGIFFQKLRE
jgi:hypothetical protein